MFFGLLLEGLRPRCQNCVLCVQKEILTKMFSEHCLFFISLGPCAVFFWLPIRILSAGSSKLSFNCPGEHFKGSLILWKVLLFPLFSVSDQKVRQCCRNCIHRLQKCFPKNFSKSVTVSIFSDFEQSFVVSPNNFLQDCQNCFLSVQRTFTGQRVFQMKKTVLLPSLLDFEQNVFVFS